MRLTKLLSPVVLILLISSLSFLPGSVAQEQPEPLKLLQKIALLHGFEGRIEHRCVDVKGRRSL